MHRIEYAPEAVDHLWALNARNRRIIVDAIESHLGMEPCSITRHRKPMRPNAVALCGIGSNSVPPA